jgi:uncharacterized protein YehS (DUF1456 family)
MKRGDAANGVEPVTPVAQEGIPAAQALAWRPSLATSPAMINNDVLRAIRYMLDLSDARVVEITRLADPAFPIEKEDVQAFLKKDEEPGYVECSNKVLAHFLDGLVVYCRGRDESLPPRPVEKRVTNNVVLKKLRVAFELKDVDMHQILEDAGFPVSKPELSALFRQPEHKNFRLCGDQLLRNFLKGLTMRLRGDG